MGAVPHLGWALGQAGVAEAVVRTGRLRSGQLVVLHVVDVLGQRWVLAAQILLDRPGGRQVGARHRDPRALVVSVEGRPMKKNPELRIAERTRLGPAQDIVIQASHSDMERLCPTCE